MVSPSSNCKLKLMWHSSSLKLGYATLSNAPQCMLNVWEKNARRKRVCHLEHEKCHTRMNTHFFWCGVFFLALSVSRPYSVKCMMTGNGFGRTRYYTGICLEGLWKTMKYLSHDSRCPERDSK